MDVKNEPVAYGEKSEKDINDGVPYTMDPEDGEGVATGTNVLHRDLKGRHMQMIAM